MIDVEPVQGLSHNGKPLKSMPAEKRGCNCCESRATSSLHIKLHGMNMTNVTALCLGCLIELEQACRAEIERLQTT